MVFASEARQSACKSCGEQRGWGIQTGDRFVPREDDYSAREDARFVVASEARQSAFLTITRRFGSRSPRRTLLAKDRRIGLRAPLQNYRSKAERQEGARQSACKSCGEQRGWDSNRRSLRPSRRRLFGPQTRVLSLRAKRGNLPVNLVVNKEAGIQTGDRFVSSQIASFLAVTRVLSLRARSAASACKSCGEQRGWDQTGSPSRSSRRQKDWSLRAFLGITQS